MIGAGAKVALLAVAAVTLPGLQSVTAKGRPRLCRHCPIVRGGGLGLPYELPPARSFINPPIVPFGDIPDPGLPDGDIPFGWSDRSGAPATRPVPPYSQGFVLTYTVHRQPQSRSRGPLKRYADVGDALAGCWDSSAITGQDWREVTVRVSFKRDGSINGVPRIQHLDAPGDEKVLSDLRSNFLSTLGQCAPLPVSPSLGAAIAGQIFAIRFIQAKDT